MRKVWTAAKQQGTQFKRPRLVPAPVPLPVGLRGGSRAAHGLRRSTDGGLTAVVLTVGEGERLNALH